MIHRTCMGVDFGGVIIPASAQGSIPGDAFLDAKLEKALQIPPTAGCLEGVRKLVSVFSGNVWIISKASVQTEKRTWAWLKNQKFTKKTGIEPTQILFCREREIKADLCKKIGVSHYLDDQVAVLELLKGYVKHLFLFSGEETSAVPEGTVRVRDWTNAVEVIRQTLT